MRLIHPVPVMDLTEEEQMPPHMTLRRHAALVDRMATALGLDLEEEVLRGRLASDALPEMVLRCTGCGDAAGCNATLSAHEAGDAAAALSETPYFCRNAGIFDDLRRR